MNSEEIIFLINHIFFPYKLPGSVKENEYEKEPILLNIASSAVDIASEFVENNNESFNEIKRMMNDWTILQKNVFLDGQLLSKRITNLKKSQALPLYMRQQNACIILKCSQENKLIFSAFQVSASNNQVMSNEADLIGIYPKFSLFVSNEDILRSNSFANQLADLTQNTTLFATSNKAGQKLNEIRDVPHPTVVFDWLPIVLVGTDSSIVVENDQKIMKKIRDDVVHENKLYPFRRSGMWMAIKVVLQLRLCELFGEVEGKITYKIIIIVVINSLCQKICEDATVNCDLKLQMIKKLARRLYKLDLLAKESNNSLLVAKTIDICAKTIETVKTSLNKSFESVILNSRKLNAELDLKKINSQDTIHEQIHSLVQDIKNIKEIDNNENSVKVVPPDMCPRNKIDSSKFPNLNHLESSIDCSTRLYDIECWIERIDLNGFTAN